MTGVFPSILPSEGDFVDDSYSRQELAQKEYSELQSIAASHESGDVHGRMGKDELIHKLEGRTRV